VAWILTGVLGLASALASADSMTPVLAADLSPAARDALAAASDRSGPAADLVPVPEPSAETLRYYYSGNVLWIVATVWGLLVPGLILFSGFSARLRDWANAVGHRWFPALAVYTILYLVTVYLLDLPLSWYQGFVRQHESYVGGLFGTQRIVLWDTLLAKLDRDQVLVVMGHEMGHYVLGHVWTLFALLWALVLASLYGVHRSVGFLIRRHRHRFGFSDASDIASLPLLVLVFSVFFLLAQPIAFAYSRHIEREADRFGLEITQANHAMATAFTVLQAENLAHPRPGPLYVLWRSRHPPIAERIEFANHYRPWESGQPLTYGSHFLAP
jgi:Zn-dependent protease with chaperone function